MAGHAAPAAPAFVEVKVGPGDTPSPQAGGGTAGAALELTLRRGVRVQVRRGFDRALLRALVAALEPPEPPESLESAESSGAST